jgi:hypothetical protein
MSLGSTSSPPSSPSRRATSASSVIPHRSAGAESESSHSSPLFKWREDPAASPAASRTPSSLGYSPSPTPGPRFTGQIHIEEQEEEEEEWRHDEVPPPPPPDPYCLEIALEESKVPGHNISSNAANVGKYMRQLQRYLQVSPH